jgi:putative transposase
MTNHIHLIATPQTAPGLSRAIQNAHHKYALFFNTLHQRSGHLWQDRFFSCPMDEEYFWKALRYVELNPTRAGIAARATDYQWSSARAHTAHQGNSRILNLPKWRAAMPPSTWKNILAQDLPQAEAQRIRDKTKLGRPLGNAQFVKDTEKTLGRVLRPKPAGRPKV